MNETTSDTRRPLTKRQREVYDFIRQHQTENGYPPTVREISRRFAIRSTNGTVCHLHALEKKGYIRHVATQARGIHLVGDAPTPSQPEEASVARVGDRVVVSVPASLSLREARILGLKLYTLAAEG